MASRYILSCFFSYIFVSFHIPFSMFLRSFSILSTASLQLSSSSSCFILSFSSRLSQALRHPLSAACLFSHCSIICTAAFSLPFCPPLLQLLACPHLSYSQPATRLRSCHHHHHSLLCSLLSLRLICVVLNTITVPQALIFTDV